MLVLMDNRVAKHSRGQLPFEVAQGSSLLQHLQNQVAISFEDFGLRSFCNVRSIFHTIAVVQEEITTVRPLLLKALDDFCVRLMSWFMLLVA